MANDFAKALLADPLVAVGYEKYGVRVTALDKPTNKIEFVRVGSQANATSAGVVQLADAASVTAGTAGRVVDAAQLKAATAIMKASGANHAAGLVPDPGATAGTAKYLREDGTWNAPTAEIPVTAINFAQDLSLNCDNVWTTRSIGTIGAGFAAADASFHYLAQRDMTLDISVTAMTSEGSGLTVGFAVQLYRAGAWVHLWADTTISNPSAGVVPFHRSAQVRIAKDEYIRFQTNANNGGANGYPGLRTFRLAISEMPTNTIAPAGTKVLVPRAISGSATGAGYDTVPVPVSISLPKGKGLNTVTATNGATVSNINSVAGTFNLTVNGADTVISHTTYDNASFTGRQTLGVYKPAAPIDINASVFTTNIDMRTAKWLVISVRDNTGQTFDGATGKASWQVAQLDLENIRSVNGVFYFETYDNAHCQGHVQDFTTGKVWISDQVRGMELVEIRVEDDAANGYVVPTGTEVRTACLVSVNGGANQTLFAGTSSRIMASPPAGKIVTAVTASAGLTVSRSDDITGALEVAVALGTTTGTITVTYGDIPSSILRFTPAAGVASLASGTTSATYDFTVTRTGLWDVETNVSGWDGDQTPDIAWKVEVLLGTTVLDTFHCGGLLSNHHNNNWLNLNQAANRLNLTTGNTYTVKVSSTASGNAMSGIAIQTVVLKLVTSGNSVAPLTGTVLTPRTISGSATGTGYDGVDIPVQIPLPFGKGLETVTATNGATVSNVNRIAGTCSVKVNGADTVLSYTTIDVFTYSGLQVVGTFIPAADTIYDTLATVTTGIDFTKCDYIEWTFRLTTNLRAITSFVPVVIGGSTPTMEVAHGSGQISSYIANAADAAAGKLTNVDCHGVAFETIQIRGWANAANGYVVPAGSVLATPLTYSTTEQNTVNTWINGKIIKQRTWTGTTPNNTSDNLLFTLPTGATFIRMEGYVEESGNSRRVNVDQAHSGNAAHGPAIQYYGADNSIHSYNATGDGRWQNMPYAITVFYTI